MNGSSSRGGCDRTRRRFLGRLGLAATGALVAAGCRRSGRLPGPDRPARLPLSSDPQSLDPVRASDIDGWRLSRLIGDSLIDVDVHANPVARLARRWEWLEDGRTLAFDLDERARWHDGRPVTSEDVAFTWRTAIDPEVAIPEVRQDFTGIEEVSTPTPWRALVHYREPYAPALLSWRTPILPRHHEDRVGHPLGCGPWRFADWRTGERIILESNAEYRLGPPALPGLRFEIIRGYAGQLDALRAGLIDVSALAPDGFRRVRDDPEFAARFAILEYRLPYIFYIAWRIDRSPPLFDDPRTRRALSMAIDRRGFLEKIADGLGDVGVTSFHPEIWGYDESLKPWPYDPQEAAALLDAAGWRPGPDGIRRRRGRAFRFRLLYPATIAENDRIAAFVQSHLRRVGVAMELEPADWPVVLDRTRERRFDALMTGRMLGFDPDPYDMWHSSQAEGGVNYSGYRDAEVDQLIERARHLHARAERTRLYHRIQRKLHEDEPMTVLFYPRSRIAVSRQLDGLAVGPAGYLDFWPGPSAWKWKDMARAARRWLA